MTQVASFPPLGNKIILCCNYSYTKHNENKTNTCCKYVLQHKTQGKLYSKQQINEVGLKISKSEKD